MLSEKEKKQLESARQQAKAFAKTEEGKKFEKTLLGKEQKKESILRKYIRLTKMAVLGKRYKQAKPKTKRKIGGVYAAYARRTAAPKTK